MLVAGEDPRFIARRIVIFASEDVGMADPQALLVATAAAQAVQNVGLPEAQLNLAQAVVHLATAPKSNSVTTALGAAMTDVRAGKGGPVPKHLRDAHYTGSRGLGHGRGYRYPHDDPRGVVKQQYVPDDLVGVDYYQPSGHGAERAVEERLPRLRRIVRGLRGPVSQPPPAASAPSAIDGSGGSVAFSAESVPAESSVLSTGTVPSPGSSELVSEGSVVSKGSVASGGSVVRTEVSDSGSDGEGGAAALRSDGDNGAAVGEDQT
jgi:putative ATPase